MSSSFPPAAAADEPRHLLVCVFVERLERVVERVGLTVRQWAALLAAVLPEAYADAGEPAGPTAAAPGSEAKQAVLAQRARFGLALRHPLDRADGPLAGHPNTRTGKDPTLPAGVRQVRWRSGVRWRAELPIGGGRKRHLGLYDTAAEAVAALDAARRA